MHSPQLAEARTNLNRVYRPRHDAKSPINLSIGHPELSHLVAVRQLLQRSAAQMLSRDDDPDEYGGYGEETGGNDGRRYAVEERLLQYADHDAMSQGQAAFRHGLAGFLQKAYGSGAALDARNLFITNGSSQGMELVCSVFSRPGDKIFVQNPTYFCALSVFQDHGLVPVEVPSDAGGMDTDALARLLASDGADTGRPRLVYSVTSFNNPSGVTLAHERRIRLIELAQRYNLLIYSDEVYHLLNYGAAALPLPMACYPGAEGRVFGAGTFSKILGPGLRMGWLQCAGSDSTPSTADTDPDAPQLIKTLANRGFIISGGGLQPFTSGVVRPLLDSDVPRQIASFREVYARKLGILADALHENLPDGCSFERPAGGFFIWLALPKGVSTSTLIKTAMQRFGVGYLPGVHCGASGKEWDNYCRICFCHYSDEELVEGARRLGAAVRSALTS